MKYCLEFNEDELDKNHFVLRPEYWENMPAMESISRCKRKLALKDELFRPDSKKVIESRLNQTNEILESVND